MKRILFVLALSALGVSAQDAKKSAGDDKRPQNPIIAALDANHDGELDSTEINNASAALKKLDKNGDGRLARQELRARRDGDQSADKPEKKKKKKKNL
jgi:hypothetical protein